MTTAIILSAGQGTRLKPLTNDRPKGMVEVLGRPIIERQLELFDKVCIENTVIAQGFCADAIPEKYNAKRYTNEDYASTNMVYSLFSADAELQNGPVVVSYGDILYSEKTLRTLLDSSADISVVVDLDWETYFRERDENPYDDAESLILDENQLITNIGQGNPKPEDVQAQYIGLMKFNDAGLKAIRELRGEVGDNQTPIGWGRTWRNAYMTDLLQELINQKISVSAVSIHADWCEIDTLTDFDLAEKRIAAFLS
jgi:L-glutamine-phosphate cytidylyltransferase